MAPRRRRTESEPVRREQLLRAARNVFREKGYDGATVADIVREAGVAQGTFYLYYSSKSAIAVSLRAGLMDRMASAVEKEMNPERTFEAQIDSLVATTFEVARQNADLYRLAFIGADETHPELHSESGEHAAYLGAVTNLFSTATASGDMEKLDPEITARLVTGLLQHAVIEAFVSEDSVGADRLEEGVSALLKNALVI